MVQRSIRIEPCPYDVSGSSRLRASQWHSLKMPCTSWAGLLRNLGAGPGRSMEANGWPALCNRPRSPAGIAPGLGGQVFQGCPDGEKTAARRNRTDAVVAGRCRCPRLEAWALVPEAGISGIKLLAGLNQPKRHPALASGFAIAFSCALGPGRTGGRRLCHHVVRHNNDQPPHRGFSGPQYPQHSAVEKPRQPRDGDDKFCAWPISILGNPNLACFAVSDPPNALAAGSRPIFGHHLRCNRG